jgi:predicted extracellular nuclease
LTVYAANVTDQDDNDPPDNMVVDFAVGFSPYDVCTVAYTPIYNIQGSGATVALTGTRTTQGVVVGDYEGPSPALRGFFIQDATGDGNPATSDGIFVFEGSNANTVSLGDVVRVTGTAGENQGQSQISVGTIVNCGTGSVTPTDVTFPVAAPDFLERYEGMLVRLPQTMYVTEHFQLGRFGQVVLSSGGRLQQPTNVVAPGAPALALQAQNNLNKIILDDAYSYVFDGQWGYLDHALGSASILSQVTGVGDYHINSDEPSVLDYNTDFKTLNLQTTLYAPDQFRVSDHDPVIVGLCLPPSLTVTVSPDTLWAPNHKYATIEAAFDATLDVETITLISITSNEPDNGQGDGDMPNDIVIVDNDTFKLRAERSGGGEGRIYTITYQAVNSCGNTVTATATVTVAHNQ